MVRTNATLLFLVLSLTLFAQPDSIHQTVNKKRLWIVGGSMAVSYGTSLAVLSRTWYSNSPSQSFRFFNDNAEWDQVDKLGHFYSAFHISATCTRLLQWTNINDARAQTLGALTGMMVLVPIEILDGFSNAYGASVGDLAADAGGALFYYGQVLAWKEPRIYPKFSYHHTHFAAIRPDILGDNWSSQLLKDYNGQTHWLCVDMDKFTRFPKWLNIAVGYGAENMIYARRYQNEAVGYQPYRQFYLSIDIDLKAIRTKSKVVKSLIYLASIVKLPAPALEFSSHGMRGHLFYF